MQYGKALSTNKISKAEADSWLANLKKETDSFIEKNFSYYIKDGRWPIKAQRLDAGQKNAKFILIHHTSNIEKKYKPALHRFLSSEKASANFLMTSSGEILYLVDMKNMSYHAIQRGFLPIAVRRALKLESGWINEPGIEIANNGDKKLFNYEQLISAIVLCRYIRSYFENSIEELKSHRFFSPISRANDPGFLFMLPLVEHAIMNDIDLQSQNYWLENYKKNPIEFANKAIEYMKKYGVENKDEWKHKRNIKITNNNL